MKKASCFVVSIQVAILFATPPRLEAQDITAAQGQAVSAGLVIDPGQAASYRITYVDTTLSNGLRVLLVERRFAPVVGGELLVKVGSRHDPPGRYGLAHLLEHLAGDLTIHDYMRRAGMVVNASTGPDVTTFNFTTPRDNLDAALFATASVFSRLPITRDRFTAARNTVIAEEQQRGSAPYAFSRVALDGLMRNNAVPPRARSKNETATTSMADVVRFHDEHYHPDNAVLVVVGDFNWQAALSRVRAHFGDFPRRATAGSPKGPTQPSIQDDARRGTIDDPAASAPRLDMGFATPALDSPEGAATAVLAALLGEGGRLAARVRDQQRLISGITVSSSFPLRIAAEVQKDADLKDAERALATALDDLALDSLSDSDLMRAKSIVAREFMRNTREDGARGLAFNLGYYTASFRRPDLINTWVDVVTAVTRRDLSRVAARYLVRARSSIILTLPSASTGTSTDTAALIAPDDDEVIARPAIAKQPARPPLRRTSAHMPADSSTTLANGLRLVIVRDPRSTSFEMRLAIRSGWRAEPQGRRGVARLTARLVREGTRELSSASITRLLDSLGLSYTMGATTYSPGTINVDALGHATTFVLRGQNPSLPAAVELMSKLIQSPALDSATTRSLATSLAPGRQNEGDQLAVTQRRLLDAIAFRTSGQVPSLADSTVLHLTHADARRFHRDEYRPDNATIVLVGDISLRDATQLVERHFAGWARGERAPAASSLIGTSATVGDTAVPTKGFRSVQYIERANARQASVGVAARMPGADVEEFPAVLLLRSIAADRIAERLRRERGWTYGVSAPLIAGESEGALLLSANVPTSRAGDATSLVLQEIERLRADTLADSVLATAKGELAGSMVRVLESPAIIAERLVARDVARLPRDHWEKLSGAIDGADGDDVRAVARKNLDPRLLSLVVLGTADAIEQVRQMLIRSESSSPSKR